MKKGLGLFFIFAASVAVAMAFQNCGESSITANSSDNNVPTDNGTLTVNGGDGALYTFDLGKGDNVFYLFEGGFTGDLKMSRILSKLYYVIMESHLYEGPGAARPAELSASYCQNSAFPHCNHINSSTCTGLGCYQTNRPVRCHWEARMSNDDINSVFSSLNSLNMLIRNDDGPVAADCADPKLFLNSQITQLDIYLGPKDCIAKDSYYSANGGTEAKALFNNELGQIDNEGDMCNNYSSYSWDSTKWVYEDMSGNSPNPSFRKVSYENAQADLEWKDASDSTIYCAENVFVNPPGVEIFFPSSGLQYEMYRSPVVVADAATTQITYEDPIDNGAVRTFYFNEVTAQSHEGGGAILSAAQGQAMKDHVEVLINRAKSLSLDQECP